LKKLPHWYVELTQGPQEPSSPKNEVPKPVSETLPKKDSGAEVSANKGLSGRVSEMLKAISALVELRLSLKLQTIRFHPQHRLREGLKSGEQSERTADRPLEIVLLKEKFVR
jgi:hypothetical protein